MKFPQRPQMRLAAHFHPTGHHVASWRHPRSQIDAGSNIAHYLEMAQTAERGLFDLIFLADALAIRDGDVRSGGRWPQYIAYFEPITLLSAMAAVTRRVGLVSTASTSYSEPFNLARWFASLDHISGGRAGWNVVTTAIAAASRNFGREEHFAHGERYDRAGEFVDIVRGLWDSWDDDAFVMDRESGIYFDPAKMHYLNHEGPNFSVRGPLHMRRPPQGHPVLFQAGSSDVGRDLAARIADVVFVSVGSADEARAIRQDILERAVKHGRSPDQILLMAGSAVCVGPTDAEAKADHDRLQASIHPDVGRAIVAAELDADMTGVPIDEPPPPERLPKVGARSSVQKLLDRVRRENLTVRQIYERHATSRGSPQVIGGPKEVADELEHWFRTGAADGFIIHPAVLPGGLDDFVDLAIPELQRRGLFRTAYEGVTLRDHLGLNRPANPRTVRRT